MAKESLFTKNHGYILALFFPKDLRSRETDNILSNIWASLATLVRLLNECDTYMTN